MQKQKNYYLLIWALAFVVYNVIIFAVLPDSYTIAGLEYSKYNNGFWIGYTGIMLVFFGNLFVSLMFFSKSENVSKTFLNYPLLRLAWSALATTFLAGTIIMSVRAIPAWVGALICILILFFYAVAVITTSSAVDAVESIEERVQEKTAVMLGLTADAEALISRAPNDEIRSECKKVYEALRYSDPVSDVGLTDIEIHISAELADFSGAVKNSSTEEVKALSAQLREDIRERAIKCKSLK